MQRHMHPSWKRCRLRPGRRLMHFDRGFIVCRSSIVVSAWEQTASRLTPQRPRTGSHTLQSPR
ncbi:hypothetical protein M430DRAFT_219728 [Amorphotheca resinae ATCC 22711]|uniref:Uncharacterized protein n=1 Tax=Amorphotheca resinae ATCC 22711 TaxID=857342 RepID=A0A2T3B5G2_AMORE|nr:hypothetical protein M430DRAFT_219728 [Amorphotheca resinae ATCC 22711]PSS21992.1 hypothetical protein M430DRAFT_219728 [Amorphotheca resinae ATCC 22711]